MKAKDKLENIKLTAGELNHTIEALQFAIMVANNAESQEEYNQATEEVERLTSQLESVLN